MLCCCYGCCPLLQLSTENPSDASHLGKSGVGRQSAHTWRTLLSTSITLEHFTGETLLLLSVLERPLWHISHWKRKKMFPDVWSTFLSSSPPSACRYSLCCPISTPLISLLVKDQKWKISMICLILQWQFYKCWLASWVFWGIWNVGNKRLFLFWDNFLDSISFPHDSWQEDLNKMRKSSRWVSLCEIKELLFLFNGG